MYYTEFPFYEFNAQLKKKACFFLNLPGLMKKNQENHFSFFPEGSSNPLFNGNSTSSGTTQIISHTHTSTPYKIRCINNIIGYNFTNTLNIISHQVYFNRTLIRILALSGSLLKNSKNILLTHARIGRKHILVEIWLNYTGLHFSNVNKSKT